MIAGEIEQVYSQHYPTSEHYDPFLKGLFGGKKKEKKVKTPKTEEEKEAAHKRRTETFQSLGGLQGVTGAIGNIVGMFKNDSSANGQGQVNFGTQDQGGNYGYDSSSSNEASSGSKVPKEALILGAIVVAGIVLYAVVKSKAKAA